MTPMTGVVGGQNWPGCLVCCGAGSGVTVGAADEAGTTAGSKPIVFDCIGRVGATGALVISVVAHCS